MMIYELVPCNFVRLVWALLVGVAMGLMLYQIGERITEFYLYPTQVNLNVRQPESYVQNRL